MKFSRIILLIALLLQSYITLSQAQKNDHKRCVVHDRAMKKSIVRVKYGRFCPDRINTSEYPNAKRMRCMGCVVRSPRKRVAIILTCKACTRAKRKSID